SRLSSDTKGQVMAVIQATKTKASSAATRTGRLFVLELSGDRIHTMNPDGSDRKTIVTNCRLPDGIAVDVAAGHIYWTNIGVPNLNDGSIERADLDGKKRKVIVPQGGTHTPKQIHLEKAAGKLYWGDREGMRVMRANLDGSQVETLVERGRGDKDMHDQMRWCVGITVDPKLKKFYWTQKGPDNAGVGCIFRANIDIPKGESPANRPTSSCCSTSCRNPSILSSISKNASSIGPIAAILRAATRSIARRSTKRRRRRSSSRI